MASDDSIFRVLVVEDEPTIRDLVTSLLDDPSLRVECASNGAEGLKLAKSKPFDLILLDVVLPHLDGISLCRLLRSDPALREVPLYMLTGKSQRDDVDAAMRAGATGYIHKPFHGADLFALIEKHRPTRPAR